MVDYLDADLKKFIDKYVTSFLAWDLLIFFHTHPWTANGADELALKLGRRAEDIDQAAAELAEKSVLVCEGALFSYSPAEETQVLIERFVHALDDREKRLLILTEVLQKR